MSFNMYVTEKDWAFREAELARDLERRQRVHEAKQARAEYKASLKQAKTNHYSTEPKPIEKVGKEKLGWN